MHVAMVMLVNISLWSVCHIVNRLYMIDTCIRHTTFCLWCHFPAMSLRLRFCTSRKGGTGGGGQVSTLGPGKMAASGLSCRKPLVSTGRAISLLLCTNGLRKWSSGHV